MKKSPYILSVAIASPLRRSFDYLPPQDWHGENLKPGVRVKVPFGSRETIGLLLEVTTESRIAPEKLKQVIEILDSEPLLPPMLMELNLWASDYYHYPVGEIMLNNLPKYLRDGKPAEFIKYVPNTKNLVKNEPPIMLNRNQQLAVTAINNTDKFTAFLLDGITGSGKTEVYLQAIEKIIKIGKQALVLVPEIGLTPQTIERFQNRFTVNLAVLHSKLSDRERLNAWLAAKEGSATIVIGTRSAIFTPLANPGIIILDEEHDLSFHQQAGFRYSARDLAVMRGKLENTPVVLGSATPSLESIYNTERERYMRLELPERAGTAMHPSFHIIDMRNQKLIENLSEQLIQKIQQHLRQDGQILLFLNRRGYSPTLVCHSCGCVIDCDHCDAHMTLHQSPYHLHCHHCGATKPVYKTCPACNNNQLIPLGLGTERIEESLRNIFPNISIIRIDRDTTTRKGRMAQIVDDIHNNRHQILIGTQMLAKGHHFPNVTMAAIINTDSGLLSSDFRANEYIAQLIMQVAGRAGRAEKPGEVYIQTHNPHHPLLSQLIKHGYYKFALENLKEREKANLPPYSYLALFRAETRNTTEATKFLEKIKKIAQEQKTSDLTILGPIPAPMQRKANYYRAQLLFSSKNRYTLHNILEFTLNNISTLKIPTKIRWALDIDPMDMF